MTASYVLAKYIRLSSEDFDNHAGGKDESNSVVNQRDLLDDFIHKTAELSSCEVLEFCDDGRSGTNFDRPAIRELLEQARRGNVHCIVVKDFSRFGRNYIEVGDYLEQIFPAWGVRFISVNDHFDSNQYFGMTGSIDIAFRNLLHDIYSRDLSEKVRSARIAGARKGDFQSHSAFYGYIKDKADKHRLLVDEEAARVVRLIFDLAENGASGPEIAKQLNADRVPTPQMRQFQLGNRRKWNMHGEHNFWSGERVSNILRDERYTGKLIACKQRRNEVGKVKADLLPKDQWIIVPNRFPPIISEEQFVRVRRVHGKGSRQSALPLKERRIFYRKIKCGVCKKAMRRVNTKAPYYVCDSKKLMDGLGCTNERIPEKHMEELLLAEIRRQAMFADESKIWMQDTVRLAASDMTVSQMQIRELRAAVQKASLNKLTAYEAYSCGNMDRDAYAKISGEHSAVIAKCEQQIADLVARLQHIQQDAGRENLFVERFQLHSEIQKLTRGIVDELVQAIYIYDSGHVEIIWNFADDYERLLSQFVAESDKNLAVRSG